MKLSGVLLREQLNFGWFAIYSKPNKRIFELALKKADLQPEDVWYIGDNYNCDIVGARNSGLFPVWYIGASRSPDEKKDVLTATHWRELMQLISCAAD